MAGKQAVLSTFSKLANALDVPIQTLVDGFELPTKPEERTWKITLTISTPYDEFDEAGDLPELLTKLLKRLGGDEIWGAKASAGSTKIEFYLTLQQAREFAKQRKAGNLSDLNIVSVKIKGLVDGDAGSAFQVLDELVIATREPKGEQKKSGGADAG